VRRAGILLLIAALAGCGGSDDRAEPRPLSDACLIRGWSASLNASDYVAAASFFAPGAIVEQVAERRLRDRADAVLFNQSLPCRARVTKVRDEGDTTLAAFSLREGPGGPCHGVVRVRFTIRDGKFKEWRQLPERRRPPGDTI
jgi:hypothetical protein